ncbi:hypothetical protein PGT21_027702 [Puccinia graminis f. sp. tritici]|uniref:Uncharacterized protein n=1 Tax=Puccinia graminis f. sp. tritici TaxID=56615 RepID=A0A5B0NQG9_PUCGR|nr:hypothetical protein PGTUg99_018235 [Puccinia graminis f. sp. tritici]KAA1091173.1 hypothetical protein PGT21_027702 [Puccinia graminis f. sp. tritici]
MKVHCGAKKRRSLFCHKTFYKFKSRQRRATTEHSTNFRPQWIQIFHVQQLSIERFLQAEQAKRVVTDELIRTANRKTSRFSNLESWRGTRPTAFLPQLLVAVIELSLQIQDNGDCKDRPITRPSGLNISAQRLQHADIG